MEANIYPRPDFFALSPNDITIDLSTSDLIQWVSNTFHLEEAVTMGRFRIDLPGIQKTSVVNGPH